MTALHVAAVQQLRARAYLRVSMDKTGRMRSTGEQWEELDEIALDESWVWSGETYTDEGSASRYATKARDDFEQLVADLRSGEFGADLLVLWESSRGSRKVGEWATMLDLCEEHGILIYVHTHERVMNPSNMHDRKTLLSDAIDAEVESAKISRRTKRAHRSQAKAGRPSGVCPIGYVRTYDRATGQLVTQLPDDSAEARALDPMRKPYAPMIRELFERIAAGHALKAIERDFERDGWRTPTRVVKKTGQPTGGTPYSAAHLRTIAQTHAYAGLRVWVPGRKAGSGSGSKLIKPEHVLDASWPAIVSRELFYRVQAVLDDPKRKTSRPGRANHMLSMIAVCAECGSPLAGGKRRASGVTYVCRAGYHVSINETALDEVVSELIVGYLASGKLAEDLAARQNRSHELSAVRDEIASIQQELVELAASLGRNEISPMMAGAAEVEKTRRLAAAQRRELKLSAPAELASIIKPGPGVEQRWRKLPLAARRQVARIVLTPDRLGELRVKRATPNGPKRAPIRERVELRTS